MSQNNFKDRLKFNYEKALEIYNSESNCIIHILYNNDNTFSIMAHSVCEHCLYCEQANQAYALGLRMINEHPFIHVALENPYPTMR